MAWPGSIVQLQEQLRSGEISAREITQQSLDRIEAAADLNIFITVCAEQALADADAADQALRRGRGQALTGIPIAHKDIFCTAGIRTTCGSRMLEDFVPPYESTVSARLREAGAICLGKTNMDEFAMGSSTENSYFGATRNPWNSQCVPGGSSGGSAAAVAADLVLAASASDTGGSIRQPAALCGVTGIKPTYGRVSRWGMVAFASSLDQAGVVARSAEDCALLLQSMAGFDPKDSTSAEQAVDAYAETLRQPLDGLRVGLPKQYWEAGIDPAVAAQVRQAVAELQDMGVSVKQVSLPHAELAVSAYYVLAPAEASSNLSRFDGVRYGHRCDQARDIHDLYTRSRGEGFGAEVKRRILVGTYALSAGYFEAYYGTAQRVRRLIKQDFQDAFEEVDLLLSPTTPEVAFGLGAKTKDPIAMYLSDVNTVAVNLAGLPALSVPVGLVQGLPVGMQLVGDYFSEALLLRAGHAYQQTTDWHLLRAEVGSSE